MRSAIPVLVLALAGGCATADRAVDSRREFSLQTLATRDDPATAIAEAFCFSDSAAWGVEVDAADGAYLNLFGRSGYTPEVRSPFNIALLRGVEFESFVLQVEMKQTGREYGHRDLCLFFGFESPTRFYYVHLASKADDHAHNVFLVNDAARTKIGELPVGSDGVGWGESWHTVTLTRHAGMTRVYFDSDPANGSPIMSVEDSTFGYGMVGVGSFDDVGQFRNLQVSGAGRSRPDDPFRSNSP